MNYNIRQESYNPYDGLFSLIGTIMGNNARERGEIKNYQAQQDFADQINALDYGNQATFTDLASRSNPNSNYTNKTEQTKAQQGLLPTGFIQSVPTSDTIGQGLLGQATQQPITRTMQAPQQANNFDFTNPMDKYSAENNPVSVTTSAPKTIQEQTALIKSQIPKAMKELIAKGYNPKDILPLLQQTANDKIAEHTATYQEKMVNDLYQGFINEENPNRKAMYAARLKQAGYDVTTPYKEFAPEYKAERFDNGNTNDAYSFNPKTGKYELQVSMAKGVTPDAQLRADTSIRTTQMNNDNRIAVKSMGGTGGGRSTGGTGRRDTYWTNYENHGGLDDDQATIDELQAREDDGDILTASERAKLTKAKSKVNTYLEKNGYNENYKDADAQIRELQQAHPDATPEEIFQFLNDRLQRS